jgi:lantibiotic transport system permease protein
MITNLIKAEWLKLRKSKILPILFISPLIAIVAGFKAANGESGGVNEWYVPLMYMAVIHGQLFLPLLTGILAAYVCRYEHQFGGWKQLLSLPVTRSRVFLSKYIVVMMLIAFIQLMLLAGLYGIGFIKNFTDPFPMDILWKSILGGWVACLPLVALQLWVSIAWSSFGAPLALNVIFTLPNILVANSETYGPWYPWAQPLLSMIPKAEGNYGAFYVSPETLLYVIVGSFLVFFIGGLTYMQRKPV